MDQQQQSRWRPTRRQVLWGVSNAALAFLIIVICGYLLGWKWTGLPKKTLWDWLQLLIIPAVLAGGGLWFNVQQRAREQRIANERAQDEALQAYLDGVAQLLTDKEQPLHNAQPGDNLSTVARARTLTVLGRLDGGRKRSVLQFLYESGLIYKEQTLLNEADLIERRHNIVNLEQANLQGVYLRRANLILADLRGANLSGANLIWAFLSEADLREADLSGADLRFANLSGADLRGEANLREANLFRANLREANLSGAYLSSTFLFEADLSEADLRGEANLSGADLRRANLSGANLRGAFLPGANLREANLSGANLIWAFLSEADLRRANLREANLSGADLRGANLRVASGCTEEQLSVAKSLEGATMPDGQILKSYDNPDGTTFEEWLRSQRRKEDDENE